MSYADVLGLNRNPVINASTYDNGGEVYSEDFPQTTGSRTTPSSSNNFSGISGLLKTGYGTSGEVMGGFNALNRYGAKYLGTELPGVAGTGPLGGTSATGLVGGAGFGYTIGSLNPFAKNKTNSQIGGTVGGIAGAAALGGMSGVAMGATLGSVVPGIGTVIGAVAGSLLGGLMGPGKPKPGASFDSALTPDLKYNGLTNMSKHMGDDAATLTSNELAPYLANLHANGISVPEGIRVGGGYGLNSGFVYYGDGDEHNSRANPLETIRYDIDDQTSRQKAYSQLSVALAKKSGITDQATLDKIAAYAPPPPEDPSMAAARGVSAPMVQKYSPSKQGKTFQEFAKEYKAQQDKGAA